jgi:hypothetical protein
MRRDLLNASHCLWCGTSIAASESTYYCSDKHSELQAQWAFSQNPTATARCPTPRKRTTRFRGTALRWAVFTRKYPYRCQCGYFHLTSNPKSAKPYEKCLAELAVALHQPWPTRKVRLAEYEKYKARR